MQTRAATIPIRMDRHEVAGGLGDLALMLPLAVGVSAAAGLSLPRVFLCVALSYAGTALVFRVPVPVQPMKAMAALVVALGLPASTVTMASLEIAALLGLIAVTPLNRHLAHVFPRPVVRGIQLAIGVLLVRSAVRMAVGAGALPGVSLAVDVGVFRLTASLVVALALAAVLVAAKERARLPAGLAVVGLGALAGLLLAGAGLATPGTAPAGDAPLSPRLPGLGDAWTAFIVLVLPQIPLSLGNAVYATDDVLRHYFGKGAARVTPARLCASMSLMNVGSALLGGLSLCHGCGGATAHYRLGARTAGATLCAAAVYAALAAVAAAGVSPLFIPGAVLAALLLYVGLEHCLLVCDLVRGDDLACATVIAVTAIVSGNLAVGFVTGFALYLVLRRSPLRRLRMRWPTIVSRGAPPPAPCAPAVVSEVGVTVPVRD